MSGIFNRLKHRKVRREKKERIEFRIVLYSLDWNE
jgi:hypothetical protein